MIKLAERQYSVMQSLLRFDQNTIANMTAALEYVCIKVPPGKDTPDIRKQIADAIAAAAENKQVSLTELRNAGLAVIEDLIASKKSCVSVLLKDS